MGATQNKYKIINKIGEGGFGEVYLIEKDHKNYALKKSKGKLSEEEIERYNKIINILSKIDNEFIIKYYSSFQEKDSFNIIMEYAGEKNLKQFIEDYKNKKQYIEENLIHNIIKQICLGLMEIHKNKLIHRDLTPDNIFINKENNIKIGDFGISKILTTNNKYSQSRMGKYHYFAPEMEMGTKYNNKVDIYSLGCIIYELFTLNEYFVDKKIYEKDCKIDIDIYNPKWQKLIDLLTKRDYHERPSIEEVCFQIHLINLKIIFNNTGFFISNDDIFGDNFYQKLKDIIKCIWCNEVLKEPEECLKCKKIYCKNCIEKTEIHKCENYNYSLNKEKISIYNDLIFLCNFCFNEVKYENIENHIQEGCLKKGNILKRINQKEYSELRRTKQTKDYHLKSKNFYI